jgi:hypothetical protein
MEVPMKESIAAATVARVAMMLGRLIRAIERTASI